MQADLGVVPTVSFVGSIQPSVHVLLWVKAMGLQVLKTTKKKKAENAERMKKHGLPKPSKNVRKRDVQNAVTPLCSQIDVLKTRTAEATHQALVAEQIIFVCKHVLWLMLFHNATHQTPGCVVPPAVASLLGCPGSCRSATSALDSDNIAPHERGEVQC